MSEALEELRHVTDRGPTDLQERYENTIPRQRLFDSLYEERSINRSVWRDLTDQNLSLLYDDDAQENISNMLEVVASRGFQKEVQSLLQHISNDNISGFRMMNHPFGWDFIDREVRGSLHSTLHERAHAAREHNNRVLNQEWNTPRDQYALARWRLNAVLQTAAHDTVWLSQIQNAAQTELRRLKTLKTRRRD